MPERATGQVLSKAEEGQGGRADGTRKASAWLPGWLCRFQDYAVIQSAPIKRKVGRETG